MRRMFAACGAFVTVMSPTVAHADAPGPTDYRTVVTRIEPAVDGVRISIVGGDSFVELAVASGTAATVPGYSGDEYLRFRADGVVEENRNSATFYANASRYGGAVPDGIAGSPPRWVQVATDGRFAWHDHRTHWMSTSRPPGKHAGDVILDAELPITVNGAQVLVHVQSTWLLPPSRLPALVGLIAGLSIAAAALRWRAAPLVVGAGAVIAFVLGAVAVRSVPSETGPPYTLWVLPLLSIVLVVAAAAGRTRLSVWHRQAATVIAATPLAVWGWSRRTAMSRALIPTDAPMWLDRFAVGLAFTLGVTCGVGMLVAAFGFGPPPTGDQRPAVSGSHP